MSYSGGYGDYGLETLEVEQKKTNGIEIKVPETRMRDAAQVQDFGRRLWQNDEKRSKKRSLVNGLVGGFPPYRQSKMRDAGLGQNCNANFNTASAYMENGSGAFYDLFSEAPGYVGIKTMHGTPEQREEYSRIMSAEADRIFHTDPLWDFEMQRSQWEMTLHGCGPLVFEDPFKVFPRAVSCGDFKVPERTKSDVNYYEVAWADIDYYPPELYDFIKDKEPATQVGWNVDFTQRCIANAMDIRQPEQRAYDWEFYNQELKNNSLSYYDDSKVVHVGYCWWKEFNGRITQAIVERESNTDECEYLFIHVGRYANFREAMAGMYFDRGNGGYHHSVTGLGVKMYSAMEFENRLLCRLMDGAFAPKVLFKPTTTEATQKMQLAHMGDYGVVPAGWEAQQMPISGFINVGLSMYRASSDLMRSNLSNYRQQPEPQKPGNPETKFGRQLDASMASTLSKTTFNRYYRQLDTLYYEIVRRLCNLNTTDERAKAYQKRCLDRGVLKECFGRIDSVEAIRVIGEGSAFLRKSSLSEMAGMVPGLPEEGQNNWKNDMIAAVCGQRSVERYNPAKSASKLPNDQHFMALEGVSMMKTGIPPIVTKGQNAVTFAGVYLTAATQAMESVQKGANPTEVLKFLELCGPAILAHLKRFAKDPLRQQVFKEMLDQWKRLGAVTDKLKKQVDQQMQKQKEQQAKTQAAMSDQEIKAMKVKGDLQLKAMKTKAQLEERGVRTKQDLALADARTASEIHRSNRLAAFKE
jgi:hypothetical protein